ncbi:MAG: hypothetical protein CUN52_12475 [Phototrophicales bacterium]|nr:MAG: hypothetical protein CUN52_12475 [Phototrophicales bacterium]
MSLFDDDKYQQYEDQFDPLHNDRQARRKRKPKAKHIAKKATQQVLEEIADLEGLEGGFKTTYVPGLFEQGWLLQALQPFYEQKLITDVLGRVKGGKEANVYRCMAHPSTGETLIAAKVYRPRMFRNLRNDAMYREGRDILTGNGKALNKKDDRTMRAIGKKTAYGQQVSHTSWLMHEYKTLNTLFQIGASVPQPFAAGENALLMAYFGDETIGAPTLHEIDLPRQHAKRVFAAVMSNIELMLQHDMIHGDLSAYNLLYWDDEVILIDFPQVTITDVNSNARTILERDITRLCDYFVPRGVSCDPSDLTHALWQKYVGKVGFYREVDVSRTWDSGDDVQ